MALVVRLREKRALRAMGLWARHPCRSEADLLPPLAALRHPTPDDDDDDEVRRCTLTLSDPC